MPRSRNPEFIDWAKSRSKKILMDDLENDVLPLDESLVPASVAWEHYRLFPEFIQEGVVYEQFESSLDRHRKAVKKKKRHFADQLSALEHDTQFMYQDTHDRRGRRIFYGTQAHTFLKQDVKNGLHLSMGVEGLYYSRDEYCEVDDDWDVAFFRRRVRQEDLTQKFHYHMEVQRAKKEKKKKESAKSSSSTDDLEYYDTYQEEDKDDVDDDAYDDVVFPSASAAATGAAASAATGRAAGAAATASARPKRRRNNSNNL